MRKKEDEQMNIGQIIFDRRRALGFTQQVLAEKLNISFQAISKWENGTSCPDIDLLPRLAAVLNLSIDALLGYPSQSVTDYENRYDAEGYYWGLVPNHLCYDIPLACRSCVKLFHPHRDEIVFKCHSH